MKTSVESNLFEAATRMKIRFPSSRGLLSVEELWDIPLRSDNNLNLDLIAQGVSKALKAIADEGSFVDKHKKNPEQTKASLAMEVVQHIIDVKLDEETEKASRATRKEQKQKLMAILEQKQGEALLGLSEAALKKKIAELDD